MIPFNRLNNYLKFNTGKDVVKGYDQTIYAFDIEDSNGYIIDGIARPFDYSKDPAYYADKPKVSVLYLWQFAVDDMVFYGRTLDDFKPALDYLAKRPYKSIVNIHNAAHEFMFLLNIIKYDSVFARKAHRPMKMEYGNVEFRCTYMLTRQSLAAIGDAIGLPKFDDFDYDEIKTPTTALTASELRYGARDVQIIVEYIKRLKSEYTTLQKIPLTQTGRPRIEVKKLYAGDMGYHYKMTALLPRNAGEYLTLKMAFVGGWVHANYLHVGKTIRNKVYAYDITSSYPTQMLLGLYPMSPWVKARPGKERFYLERPKDFCCLIKLAIANLSTFGYNDYLSESKIIQSESRGVKHENGRIYEAERITVYCTNVDYQIMRECYAGDFEILDLWYSTAGYLDRRYVEYILELYNNKVQLTGDPTKEELRARSKEILNALYGMMVSSLYYPDISFDVDRVDEDGDPLLWVTPETAIEKIEPLINDELQKLRSKPYKIFTSYSHGLFVTAYARMSLWKIIRRINKDIVYHDTDSIYCIGAHRDIIDEYNADIKRQLLELCNQRGIDPDKVHPRDLKGREQWLGVYTCDNDDIDGKPFAEFKTLGAKRYCYRMVEPPKSKPWVMTKKEVIKITVAGVSKSKGALALNNDIERFKDGLVFDYEFCNKLLPHYNDNQPVTTWVDRDGKPYVCRDRYGITLQPSRYVLDRGQTFVDTLLSMGALSNLLSEMSVDELLAIANKYEVFN